MAFSPCRKLLDIRRKGTNITNNFSCAAAQGRDCILRAALFGRFTADMKEKDDGTWIRLMVVNH